MFCLFSDCTLDWNLIQVLVLPGIFFICYQLWKPLQCTHSISRTHRLLLFTQQFTWYVIENQETTSTVSILCSIITSNDSKLEQTHRESSAIKQFTWLYFILLGLAIWPLLILSSWLWMRESCRFSTFGLKICISYNKYFDLTGHCNWDDGVFVFI